jgi:hypothetical protein
MIKCRSVRPELAAFLSGELGEDARKKVLEHLESCAACRREISGLRELLRDARTLGSDIEREMESVDWEAQAERIASAAWESRTRPEPGTGTRGFRFFAPGLRPVLAGAVMGAVLGALAVFLILKRGPADRPAGDRYFASADFLERVDLEIARRDTLDYLEKSQYVLLDIVGPDAGASAAAAGRARELLAKKKFLNSELDKARMAKAREICDQIELLFYQLADVSSGLTDVQRSELRNLVEKKDLLLKIRLLKRDLQESEV